MYVNEEEAFWMLVSILKTSKSLLRTFYVESFPLLKEFQWEFGELLKEHCPKWVNHCDALVRHDKIMRHEVDPGLYTPEWFMTLFARNLPLWTVLRIWDIFFNEGTKIFFRVALLMVKLGEPELIKYDSTEDLIKTLKKLHETPILKDPDKAIEEALKVKLSTRKLRKLHDKQKICLGERLLI